MWRGKNDYSSNGVACYNKGQNKFCSYKKKMKKLMTGLSRFRQRLFDMTLYGENMEYRTLESTELIYIYEAFTQAFSDYQVTIDMPYKAFETNLK